MCAEVAIVGACAKDGPEGGLQALAALQQGPFSLVHLHGLPAQGGFHAALAGMLRVWQCCQGLLSSKLY